MATSTLGNGTLVLAGTTSGTTTVTATAVAGTTTLTLPAATDTLVGKATTDTLTNKTLTGAAMNGTLGATTPSTVAATTLTTSSTVTHNGGTANGVAYLNGSKVLTTGTALVFDGTNLGIKFTPSAWQANNRAIQVADGYASLSGNSSQGTCDVAYNCYNTTSQAVLGWKYTNSSAAATLYQQLNGIHAWHIAPSGTADTAITFTQAMTLDASGFYFLGCTTTPSASVKGIRLTPDFTTHTPKFSTGSATSLVYMIEWINGNGIVGSISTNGSATAYNTGSDYRLKNITGPITTSGAYIDSLNPVEGTWKADGSTFVGLIAHEVQEASRTQVATGVKDGEQMQAMDYSNSELIANLIAEVKSLRQRLAAAGI